MTKPNFDMTINMGNVITLVALIIGVAIGYGTLTVKSDLNAKEIDRINNVVITIPSTYIPRNEFQSYKERNERIEAKLDRLIEIQLKSN